MLPFLRKEESLKKEMWKFIGKQLRYLKRNLSHIEKLLGQIAALKERQELLGMILGIKEQYPHPFPTSKSDQKIYWVIQHIYH